MTDTEPDEVRDFTLPSKPIRFKIDDDEFAAPAIISIIVLRKIAKLYAEAGPKLSALSSGDASDEQIGEALYAIADMFKTLIPGPSGVRFAQRLLSEDEPIDLNRQAMPVLQYLLERYGMRPTQPASPSPSGSSTPNGGTSSTDGALSEASDSTTSPSPTG
jgi:hypothetical protein